MAMNWLLGGTFAAGLLLGALGGAVVVGPAVNESPAAASTWPGWQVAAAPEVDCSFAPIVPVSGRDDGMLPLDKDLQGRSATAVSTLILSGKEAAAAGRRRDAETAFLMACRSAELLKNDPLPLADAHYQLGRHYAQLAAAPDAPKRAELLRRAETLYTSSLQVLRARRGENHEKTRFAQQGLEALQQLARGPAPVIAAAPAPAAPAAPSEAFKAAEHARAAEQTKVAGAGSQPPSAPVAARDPAAPTRRADGNAASVPTTTPEQKEKASGRAQEDGAVRRPAATARPARIPVARATPESATPERTAPEPPPAAPVAETIVEPPAAASGSAGSAETE